MTSTFLRRHGQDGLMASAQPSKLGLVVVAMALLCTAGQAGAVWAGTPPGDLGLEFVVGGFTRPLAVVHSGDQSGRLFIVEQRGVIRIFDLTTNTLLAAPFLDIQALVDDAADEQGLLGLAFHPDYKHNGRFFVNYTRDPGAVPDRTVIRRYNVSSNPNVADATSGVTLLEFEQDFANHNGGNVVFGPDGYLYIGTGDGGSGEDPNDRAQDVTQLLGKMLRIDVDSATPSPNDLCGLNPTEYAAPSDNPYVPFGGRCDEIWAYGLRNPWRYSFDRANGDLLIADVGQGLKEEVDWQPASSTGGENYGWPCKEGLTTQNFGPCNGALPIDPIFEYTHALGFSITGGNVYRGPIASLRGNYVAADYITGRIWFGEQVAGTNWNFALWTDTTLRPSSFGEDENGNVYMASFITNSVYRLALAAAGGAGAVPDGSGATTPFSMTKAGADVILNWSASCDATDTDFGVYEGDLGDFYSHDPRLCTTGGTTTATFQPQGASAYYLVVPHNDNREGSYGLGFGVERPAGVTNTCFDQALANCP